MLSNAANERSAHGQAFVDRFRFNAKRAALVQSRIKAIERLADVETIASDPGQPWHRHRAYVHCAQVYVCKLVSVLLSTGDAHAVCYVIS